MLFGDGYTTRLIGILTRELRRDQSGIVSRIRIMATKVIR